MSLRGKKKGVPPSLGSAPLTVSRLLIYWFLFFFSFSSSWGKTHSLPRGLGFLHGICMIGWVDSTHSCHTVWTGSMRVEFFMSSAFVPFMLMLFSLSVCRCVASVVGSSSLGSSLPPPPPSSSSPLYLRRFRRHPQTHSHLLNRPERALKLPAASQTGVQRLGFISSQPCWK